MGSRKKTESSLVIGPMARTILDSLSAHISILDSSGVIVATNRAWRRYAETSGMSGDPSSIGQNYLTLCDAADKAGDPDAGAVAKGIRGVIAESFEEFLYDYPCHSPSGRQWYYMRVIQVADIQPIHVIVSHENITALKNAEETLQEQKRSLEEANIALRVLLKQRESDKEELEQSVLANIRESVLPHVERLNRGRLRPRDREQVTIIETRLNDIASPLLKRLSSAEMILTPQEIQVATFVKEGRSSKEIAELLNVSPTTVHFHRKNLRKKFGLSNRNQNLRAYLLSMS